jgi:hypothetical protein
MSFFGRLVANFCVSEVEGKIERQKTTPPEGVFGSLQVRLDPWQPGFGPEFAGFDDMTQDGQESIDMDLERPRDRWEPLTRN